MFRKILSTFLIIYIVLSCSEKTTNPPEFELVTINSYDLQIQEPSGLTFGKDYQTLWVVSDLPYGSIYEIDLEGNILHALNFRGDDLEGITYDKTEDVLWAVDEQKNEIIKLSPDQGELERVTIPVQASADHGLEGISFESQNKYWIANEKLPKKLFLLNSDFSIEQEFEPDLAKDYSGLCVNPASGTLWIISDESQLLIKWSPTDGTYEKYDLPMEKAEGIAINHQSGQIFIVSDGEQKLYQLEIKE
jgi:uncharacterized protein YjiK